MVRDKSNFYPLTNLQRIHLCLSFHHFHLLALPETKRRDWQWDFFLMHSVVLPNTQEPKSHLACAKWPMVHPNRHYFGKPVEVWCNNIYETQSINRFFPAAAINARAIISSEKISGECVCIAIPIVEWILGQYAVLAHNVHDSCKKIKTCKMV